MNEENGEIHGLLTKHRDFVVVIFFFLFLLKSAEAVILIAVICIISGVQQNKKPGCSRKSDSAGIGQGLALLGREHINNISPQMPVRMRQSGWNRYSKPVGGFSAILHDTVSKPRTRRGRGDTCLPLLRDSKARPAL